MASPPSPEPAAVPDNSPPPVVQNITYNISDSAISGNLSPTATPPEASGGPPLPPEGLPAGWTMEQWEHYGQQYLDGQL